MINNVEKQMKEHGDKLTAEDKTKIEDSIKDVKDSLKESNVDDIKSKVEVLTQDAMKLGEAVYKAQQEEASTPNQSDKAKDNKEDVVDAEFEEVGKN